MAISKEKKKEYNQNYYEKNKTKLKRNSLDYYNSNKEAVLESVKKYRDSKRELIQEKGREYYRRKIKNRMLNAARARSKSKNLDFSIDETDFDIPEKCPLLGIDLFIADGRKAVKNNSPSLDRIDSKKGYVKGNVWVISHRANTIKSDACVEEIEKLLQNWKNCVKTGPACDLLYNHETGRINERQEDML